MSDEKDRLGDKLRDVEKAREDQFFAKRDRELIERLRKAKAGEAESALKDVALLRCPKCGERLHPRVLHEVTVEECRTCGGLWLDKGEFETLARREAEGWLGRLLSTRSG